MPITVYSDDKIDETLLYPLSYGPHIFGGPPGLEPGSVIFNDVVPSAFVTKLSKVAGDKIEESPAVVIGGQGSNLLGTMYSLLHSPAN